MPFVLNYYFLVLVSVSITVTMPKRHMLIDPTDSPTSKHSKHNSFTNWELCVLCQVETAEALQCPVRSSKQPVGNGYKSLAKDLLGFQELGYIPAKLDLDRLDDGSGIELTLMTNRALWHKSCRLKYNQTKLKRHQNSAEKTQQLAESKIHTRSAHDHVEMKEHVCFFCNKPAGLAPLHKASTKGTDMNVRNAALETQDTALLAKLAAGDMIAIEAKYHRNCLRDLYNKARSVNSDVVHDEEAQLHGIAFAELVAFIEETQCEDCAPVFKLADLRDLYKARLNQLGVTVEHQIHTTRLKNRLIFVFPDMRAHSKGRDVLLTFEDNLGEALWKACDYDSDAMQLVRAAHLVRKELFDTKYTFDGSFHPDCQKDSVPPSLLALMKMILDGANIKHQTQLMDTATTKAALTVSQLLVFNSVKHTRTTESSDKVRHNRDRETPLPLYIAMKVHAVTRKRGLIDTLFNLGVCISYDRLLQVSTDIANGVCHRFEIEEVVCPPKMRSGLFTTAAVDNIDHNTSSTTAVDSFHGTAISLIQHPTHECAGFDRGVNVINESSPPEKAIVPLPQAYTNVKPVAINKKQLTAPPVIGPVGPPNFQMAKKSKEEEFQWLKAVIASLDEQETNKTRWISWYVHCICVCLF